MPSLPSSAMCSGVVPARSAISSAVSRSRVMLEPERRRRRARTAPRCSLHVRSRICLEGVVADLRAVVVGVPSVLEGPRGLLTIDAHPAHGIFHHSHPVPLRALGVRPDQSSRVLETRIDTTRNEGGVVAHESDKRGPSGVLPGEPDEEQAGSLGNPAPVPDAATLVPDTGHVDPGEVRSIARRPHDGVDVLLASIVEHRAPPNDAHQPLPQGHAGPPKSSGARSDEHVAFGQLPTESRIAADLLNPIPDNHQNRSLPSRRCGRDGTRCPKARSTCLVAASSSAIWKPELPPPTTST